MVAHLAERLRLQALIAEQHQLHVQGLSTSSFFISHDAARLHSTHHTMRPNRPMRVHALGTYINRKHQTYVTSCIILSQRLTPAGRPVHP